MTKAARGSKLMEEDKGTEWRRVVKERYPGAKVMRDGLGGYLVARNEVKEDTGEGPYLTRIVLGRGAAEDDAWGDAARRVVAEGVKKAEEKQEPLQPRKEGIAENLLRALEEQYPGFNEELDERIKGSVEKWRKEQEDDGSREKWRKEQEDDGSREGAGKEKAEATEGREAKGAGREGGRDNERNRGDNGVRAEGEVKNESGMPPWFAKAYAKGLRGGWRFTAFEESEKAGEKRVLDAGEGGDERARKEAQELGEWAKEYREKMAKERGAEGGRSEGESAAAKRVRGSRERMWDEFRTGVRKAEGRLKRESEDEGMGGEGRKGKGAVHRGANQPSSTQSLNSNPIQIGFSATCNTADSPLYTVHVSFELQGERTICTTTITCTGYAGSWTESVVRYARDLPDWRVGMVQAYQKAGGAMVNNASLTLATVGLIANLASAELARFLSRLEATPRKLTRKVMKQASRQADRLPTYLTQHAWSDERTLAMLDTLTLHAALRKATKTGK